MVAPTKKVFVSGVAGFIGSHLLDRLIREGYFVVGFDNFSTGRESFISQAQAHAGFQLVRGDLLDLPALMQAMNGCGFVYHLAANADVRLGPEHPRRDLERNTLGTFNILEAMRLQGIRRIVFTSSSSVYGEPEIFPTPEDAPFPMQTSLYGASKLACEALIEAYCEGFSLQAWIFRLASILGERYTHGHAFDFCRQLRAHPDHLEIFGDGSQRKSYLYIQDCIDAVRLASEHSDGKINIFNVGHVQYCSVNESVDWICSELRVSTRRVYSGGSRGWIGDSPFVYLDTSRIARLGWKPTLSIREATIRTLRYLQGHSFLLEEANARIEGRARSSQDA